LIFFNVCIARNNGTFSDTYRPDLLLIRSMKQDRLHWLWTKLFTEALWNIVCVYRLL